jgi:hypothetical protein
LAAQTPVPLKLSQGGRLAPDLALTDLGLNNFSVQRNWRTENGCKVKREGYDYFAPNGASTNQRLNASSKIVAERQIRRPNGKTAIVAVETAGNIWAFSFDTSAWVQIGSGFTAGSLDWQIEEVAGYAVFNNPLKDLPCTWQIGDAAVKPIYELREQKIAAVGHIKEFNGQLHCEDLVEILDDEFDGIMNGADPYGPVASNKVQRVAFKKIWSNFGTQGGGPRDFAASALGSITSGSPTLTLDYPMLSLEVGDEILVTGAGTAGGNLQTTISAIADEVITLATNAITTATDQPVLKPDALSSVVGFYELEDDGSRILCSVKLKNRHVVLKAGGSIYVGYYTGDIEEPYFYEEYHEGDGSAPRFPRTVINVNGDYLWWVGEGAAYRWTLGRQAPVEDRTFAGCLDSLFYARVKSTDAAAIFAVVNPCNTEILLCYEYESGGTVRRMLAANYAEPNSAPDEIDAGFTAACVVNRPTAGYTADDKELWFLFGTDDGKIVRNGKSNQEVFTQQRFGVSFWSEWLTGLGDFGASTSEKDVHGYALDMADPSGSLAVEFSLYATNSPSIAPTLQETKTLNDPSYPGFAPLYYRNIYFQERIRTQANAAVRITKRDWLVSGIDSRATTRVQA